MPIVIDYAPVGATAQLAQNAYLASQPQRTVSTAVAGGGSINAENLPGDIVDLGGGHRAVADEFGHLHPLNDGARGGGGNAAGPAPGSNAGTGTYFNNATGETSDAYGKVGQVAPAPQSYEMPQTGTDAATGQDAAMPGTPMQVTAQQKMALDNLKSAYSAQTPEYRDGVAKIMGWPKPAGDTVDYTVQDGDGSGFKPGMTIPLKPADAARFITQGKAAAAKVQAQTVALQARDDAQQARFKQQSDLQLAAIKARNDLMLAEADVKAQQKSPEEAHKAQDAYWAAIGKADADAVNMAKEGVDNLFREFSHQATAPTPAQQAQLAKAMEAQQAALDQRQKHADDATAAKLQRTQATPGAARAAYSKTATNPQTGQKSGFNAATGKWELLP